MELKAYIGPLRKWWWLIVLATVIATLFSFIMVSRQPSIYEAKSTLLIGSAINNPNPTGNEFWLSQQLAQTYTDIAQRDVVRQAVMDELGLTWIPSYAARAVPDTQLIEVIVTDTSPERAMVVANELAKQLILRTPTSGGQQGDAERQAFIRQQLDDLEVDIENTKTELLAKQADLAGLFSARQIADAQNQVSALNAKLDTLQRNYASLLASTSQGAVNSLSVIEPATLPKAPIGPDVVSSAMTAAAVGLFLSVGAAYLLEYMDDTVKEPGDVSRSVSLATLTGIAEHKPESEFRKDLVTLTKPRSPIAEAYRGLRTAVLFANVDRPVRSVLFTSANPGEGKSFTAANLGIVLAQAGYKVLLIDADLRRPKQHTIFEKTPHYGLTNLLIEMPATLDPTRLVDIRGLLERGLTDTPQSGLYLLPTGDIPPNPAEMIGSAKMKSLLEGLGRTFDYVIIDTPPVLAVTDAALLSARVDSVILVADAGRTRRNQLKQAVQQLRAVNANLAGVVLNRISSRTGEYYYYHKGYYASDAADGKSDGKPAPAKDGKKPGHRRLPLQDFLTKFLS